MKNHVLLIAVLFFALALSALAGGEKNLVNNPGFEQGMPGYMEKRGSIVLDYDLAHEGLISLKLDASKGKNYASINTNLIPVNAGKQYRLSCYIKNDKAIEGDGFYIIALQVKTGKVLGWWTNSGKVRKLLVTKEATNGWLKKEVVMDGFRPGTSKVKLYFRLKGKGIVNIDDISLEEIKMQETLVDDFSSDSWGLNLGREFRGANGSKALGQTEFKSEPSAMCVDFDFSGGGKYVGIQRKMNIPEKVKKLSFQAKISAKNNLMLRIVDNIGQTHQLPRVSAGKVDAWNEVIVPISKKSFRQHWGGKIDGGKGKINFPIKSLLISVSVNNKIEKADRKGTLYIDDLKFYTLDAN